MTSTVVWTASQTGNVGGGIFSQNSPLMFLTTIDTASLLFDSATGQTLRFATVGGQTRCLDGPIVTGFSFSFTIDVLGGGGGSNTIHLKLGYVPEGPVADYSQTLQPWTRNEQSLGILNLGVVPVAPNNPLPVTVTLTSLQMTDLRARCTSRAGWNGKVGISIRQLLGDPTEIAAAGITATTTQEIFFGGLTGGGGGKLRAVRDGRYAMPAWNTELVRDGDQQGLFVRPWDSDPEDPPATYKRKPGEGQVDDHIPDL